MQIHKQDSEQKMSYVKSLPLALGMTSVLILSGIQAVTSGEVDATKDAMKAHGAEAAASLKDTVTPENPENTALSGDTAATDPSTAVAKGDEGDTPVHSGETELGGAPSSAATATTGDTGTLPGARDSALIGGDASAGEPAVVQAPPREEDGIAISKTNLRASDFIGAKVKNTSGNDLGEITDLMINWPENKLNYAILSSGGVAGLGAKQYAIPIDKLKAASQGAILILDLPKIALERANPIDAKNPPEMADATLFESSGDETSEFSSMEVEDGEKSLLEKAADKLSGKNR